MRILSAIFLGLLYTAFLPIQAFGQDTVGLHLDDQQISKICPSPVWKNFSVVWEGVKDKRPTPEVGSQTKKGEVINEVMADPPVEMAFDTALRKLLPACGMKIETKTAVNTLHLSAEITEFSAGVEKKLFTGKGEAQSRIVILFGLPDQTPGTVEIGFKIENKQARQKNIRQLEATLNDLFVSTLEQIPQNPHLKELK